MSNKIRLIASDLDGTLLDSNSRLSDRTRRTLAAAAEQGIVILPATGRPGCAVPDEIRKLPGVRYIMTSNGASVYDMQTGQNVYEVNLGLDRITEIRARLADFDVWTEISISGISYVEGKYYNNVSAYISNEHTQHYLTDTRTPVESLDEVMLADRDHLEKICFFFKDEEIKKQAMTAFGHMDGVDAVDAVKTNFEISDRNATKGEALKAMAGLLGIPMNATAAFGDGMNDRTMIMEAGIGFAMENAGEDVKAAADHITLSNDDDGVASAIEKWILTC